MEKISFAIRIDAPKEKVWNVLWDNSTYPVWTTPFCKGSKAITDWQEGSKVLFFSGSGEGMVSFIAKNKPNEFMSFRHLGIVKDGVEDTNSDAVKPWAGAMENYTLTDNGGTTTLTIEMDTVEANKSYFVGIWPKALEEVKRLSESANKITPFLWFDSNAEEAINMYVSIFKDAKILSMVRYGNAGPGPKGTVMTAAFELNGQRFTALNGGPHFKFTEAISFVVHCDTQEEVDHYWHKLSEGGEEGRCAWLKDKFGLSWQIVPNILIELLKNPDPKKSQRVMQAMIQMGKIDIAVLKQAAEQNQ